MAATVRWPVAHLRACPLGLTLGPATGRLLAEMMTGATPFCDPAPYRAERFGS
jgi:glycine/D-amino acid oxidase-like deaminating enzyme